MLRLFVKCVWAGGRELRCFWRLCFYKSLAGSYFASVGRKTRFFGRVRFGSVEGNIRIGTNCMFGHDVFLSASRGTMITIGNSSTLNNGCHVVAAYGITIGDNTHVGEFCSIRDQNHCFEDPDVLIQDQGFCGAPIRIGSNVWIGRGVFIGPGVNIGDGAVVGANSVVIRSIPPYSVAVGNPIRLVRKRGGIACSTEATSND